MRSQEVTEYYTLNQAKKHKSKTRPYPFIIAHECDRQYTDRTTGLPAVKNREFLVFDDVDTFIELREKYQHAHEVIWDRYIPDKQQGRLIFDFDFDDAWYGLAPKFVAPSFQGDIEALVLRTFEMYYVDVDCTRFIFVWLISDVDTKWSKHLIVKHAYFSDDWKTQSQIFYHLMLGLAEAEGFFAKYGVAMLTEKMFDSQVARSNATMRMLGSVKLPTEKKPNPKPLKLESSSAGPGQPANLFDTLVQLYRREDVKAEQHINQACLRKGYLNSLLETKQDVMMRNKFYKQVFKLMDVDVDRLDREADLRMLNHGEINTFFKIFEQHYCLEFDLPAQTSFRVKSSKGSLIILERLNPGKCLISEKVHDAENAFLTITANNAVYFHCYRGCDRDGKRSVLCHPPDFVEIADVIRSTGEKSTSNAQLLRDMLSPN